MNEPKTPFKLPPVPPLSMERGINFVSPISWGVKDPARFSVLMQEVLSLVSSSHFLGDNLFTWGRNNSALEDPAFQEAWRSNTHSKSDRAIVWRRYILATTACHGVQLEGDFVECGVNAGTGIKTVMDYLGGTAFPKTFWGYDTYDYHPSSARNMEGQSVGQFERVQERFANYPQVRLIKGLLPESFSQGSPDKVAFLHIDLNNAEGEIAALEQLFDRVVPGGTIILDDYEWSAYRNQKREEDQWFQQRDYRVIPLPTGQGMVIKR